MEELILNIGGILMFVCILLTLWGLLEIFKYILKIERKLIEWEKFYYRELKEELNTLNKIAAGMQPVDALMADVIFKIKAIEEVWNENI